MVIQCKNLISLYILTDQRRVNLLAKWKRTLSFRWNPSDILKNYALFQQKLGYSLKPRVLDQENSLLRKNFDLSMKEFYLKFTF